MAPTQQHQIPWTAEVERLLELSRVSLSWRSAAPRAMPANLSFSSDLAIEAYSGIYAGANLCSVGAFSYSHSAVQPGMSIGRYCAISWGLVVTGPRHPYEWATINNISYDRHAANIQAYLAEHPDMIRFRDARVLEKSMPHIGHDVWIGQNVTLNRGVRIGHGAVIAAYSVVTRDVPPYTIVGGNPAKVIKARFPERTVYDLLDLQWWDFGPKDFMDLDITEVGEFVSEMSVRKRTRRPFEPAVLTADMLIEQTERAQTSKE